MERSQDSKSRSRDTFLTPLTYIFSFLSLVTLVLNLHAKFEVIIRNRSRDMEGVPKFQKQVT